MRDATWEALVCAGQYNIQAARQAQAIILRAAETADS